MHPRQHFANRLHYHFLPFSDNPLDDLLGASLTATHNEIIIIRTQGNWLSPTQLILISQPNRMQLVDFNKLHFLTLNKEHFNPFQERRKTITNHFHQCTEDQIFFTFNDRIDRLVVVHCTVSFPRLVTNLSGLAFANAHNGRLSSRQITFPHPHNFPVETHTRTRFEISSPTQSISNWELIFRHQVRRSCRFDWSTLNEHLTIIEPSLWEGVRCCRQPLLLNPSFQTNLRSTSSSIHLGCR